MEGLAIRLGKGRTRQGRTDFDVLRPWERVPFGVKRTNHNDETPLTKVRAGERPQHRLLEVRLQDAPHAAGRGAPVRRERFGSGDEYRADANGYGCPFPGAQGLNEGALDCTHIYPSRVGTVSGVIVADEGKHF